MDKFEHLKLQEKKKENLVCQKGHEFRELVCKGQWSCDRCPKIVNQGRGFELPLIKNSCDKNCRPYGCKCCNYFLCDECEPQLVKDRQTEEKQTDTPTGISPNYRFQKGDWVKVIIAFGSGDGPLQGKLSVGNEGKFMGPSKDGDKMSFEFWDVENEKDLGEH